MPIFSPARSISVSQTTKAHHNQVASPLHRVAIFWDYESCRPAGFMPAYTIVDNIRDACLPYGSITTFKAYVEKADAYVSTPPTRPLHYAHPSLREQLQLYGVALSYYSPSTRSTMGERQLLVDMMLFALDNPAPSTVIILITAEELSPYAISALRLRHYKLVLITPQNNGNPLRPAMAAQANEVIDWAVVMSRGRRSPAEAHSSSPGSVSSVSTMPISPTTRRMTPAATVSSGGTVVDTASVPAPRPISGGNGGGGHHGGGNGSTSSRSSSISQPTGATSLTNPTPLFPVLHNPVIPFQPFRAGAFTPRSQPGLGRVWGHPFPQSSTGLFPTPLNTNTSSMAAATTVVGHGPSSAVSSSSSLTSPTSNWTQSPPPTTLLSSSQQQQLQHHSTSFGPVGTPLSPTESIVRRGTQFQPAETRSVPSQSPQTFTTSHVQGRTPPLTQAYPTSLEQREREQQQREQQQQQQLAQQQVQQIVQQQQQQQQQLSQAQAPTQVQMPQPHNFHQFQLPHSLGGPVGGPQQPLPQQAQQPPPPPSFVPMHHIDPRHFELLINILTEFRNEGKLRPYRSKIGSELVQRDRLVYQRAGVTGFKEYVGYAEQIGLVRLGGHSGSPGKEWIELINVRANQRSGLLFR